MQHITARPAHDHPLQGLIVFLVISVFTAGVTTPSLAATLEARYPGVATGALKSAKLASMDKNILLTGEGITIERETLLAGIQGQPPELRAQLEKNLLFLLEQEAVRQILLHEAQKAGIDVSAGDDNRAIQALFEQRARTVTVSDDEARAFYEANTEMMSGAPYEQVAGNIRQYLLQDKRQQAIAAYVDSLGDTADLRINETWAASQHSLALDNPVDRARRSGKPTMVEFGSEGCVPCDMMQPILDKLRKDYPDRLNVVFVKVGEEQVLAARYGIRSIPVQVFYNAGGQEVFRHVGFFAEKEVRDQLQKAGLKL